MKPTIPLVNGPADRAIITCIFAITWNWVNHGMVDLRITRRLPARKSTASGTKLYAQYAGWFLLGYHRSGDIEWMMARAAGYHAGFALVGRYSSLQTNPNTVQFASPYQLWKEASRQKIFSADQLARLKDPGNDFHLEKNGQNWELYPFKKYRFEHTKQLLQPGQPTYSEWDFEKQRCRTTALFYPDSDGKQKAR